MDEIKKGSITSMGGLTDRPVYFLYMNQSTKPTIVVKGETALDDQRKDTKGALLWGSKMMRNVHDERVRVKLLSSSEIAVFKAEAMKKFGGQPQAASLSEPGLLWLKMPYVHGLENADTQDKSKLQILTVVGRLTNAKFWFRMGQIVAVDIFIGNNDRFSIEGMWQNQTNVMFVVNSVDGSNEALGLDTFDGDRKSQQRFVTKSGTGGYKELRILVDKQMRLDHAKKCLKSVARLIKLDLEQADPGRKGIYLRKGEQMISVDLDELADVFLEYADEFAKGIADGAIRLRQYLSEKRRKYQGKGVLGKDLPVGILERMESLGWL